jgi:hypothetical protein
VIVAVAILVALACVLASARRMWFAANPTALHPDDVVASLGRSPDRAALARLRELVAEVPNADWERDLLDALSAPCADARAALVNEQLTELDLRMQRWARVPRVCASVATSVGIMLGTLVLRNGLANAPDLTGDLGELFVRDVLNDAISVAAFGIVGTAFCIAAHAHARRMTRARLEAADRMIEKLEAAVGTLAEPASTSGAEQVESEQEAEKTKATGEEEPREGAASPSGMASRE